MFKVDFINGEAVTWTRKEDKVVSETHPGYRPRFYIDGDRDKIRKYRPYVSSFGGVEATCFEKWKPGLGKDRKKVLRVDVKSEKYVKKTVRRIRSEAGVTEFSFYNISFSPQFRFCLQREVNPVPQEELNEMKIDLDRKKLADKTVSGIRLNGETISGPELEVVEKFCRAFRSENPDIVSVNRGQVLKLLQDKISDLNQDLTLGRTGSFEKLAGENTVSSYGKTLHSSARYNLPGRIVIDRSNSFLLGYENTSVEGLWRLVEMSHRPLQELAWGSIGKLLTSIQIRKAQEKGVLTPWRNRTVEEPKKASTFHIADRGGFIFNPEPGIHRNVWEADFASLFPEIMVKKNISPETVNCSCCENSEVPELDYTICRKNRYGFIPETLEPIIEMRQDLKERKRKGKSSQRLKGSIKALKMILVTCFGYMGHEHAAYGSIECHQAIQAYDREIMTETKEMFERSGYSIAHGIIDSLWVKPGKEAENFEDTCQKISEEIGIPLEPEHRFEWCAFIPRSGEGPEISTLNRYFGKTQDGEFKTAGIEYEQKSTSRFVKKSQMQIIEALDRQMSSEDVMKVLRKKIDRLESGDVDARNLFKTRKVSKTLQQYSSNSLSALCLRRAREKNVEIMSGQELQFLVSDNERKDIDRVRLGFEDAGRYDETYYIKELVRAAETVLSPLGIKRKGIRERLEETGKARVKEYTD